MTMKNAMATADTVPGKVRARITASVSAQDAWTRDADLAWARALDVAAGRAHGQGDVALRNSLMCAADGMRRGHHTADQD